ncbi:hypothetical protein [Arthrobacter sp. HMWF013]|uniref:hypothetical protein n=1 Tax=Arthrobacter sp. HMWF013 TaxID=2056849 RepID=UPI000D390DA3|nr:hypothetical protein [Arthrobacter sp. HMWF013]PTT70319.1 hypothetical protein DBR22_01455 [Arthrobacter sp. HMWF013]
MEAMNQAPPTDFAGMTDRLLNMLPIMLAALAVLGLAVWLYERWRNVRNLQTYVDVVNDVQNSGGNLPADKVDARAFRKYLALMDAKTMPKVKTKNKP